MIFIFSNKQKHIIVGVFKFSECCNKVNVQSIYDKLIYFNLYIYKIILKSLNHIKNKINEEIIV